MENRYTHTHSCRKPAQTGRPRLEGLPLIESDKDNKPKTAGATLHLPESLVDIFKPEGSRNYHMDGDFSMYTTENLAKRKELSSDPIVKEAIEDFMGLFEPDADGLYSKETYQQVYLKICHILRPDISQDDVLELFEDDWKKDSNGLPKLTRQLLYNCLYELCDIWCPNIDTEEYKNFFLQLKLRITYEGYNTENPYNILG